MKKFILLFAPMMFIFLIHSTGAYADFYNNPPNPPLIEGPTSGQIGITYTYNFTLTDPDYDDTMFNLEVDFGNNVIAEDCGCDKSWTNGTIVELSYQWSKSNDYNIRARVQGEYGDWSEWSEPYIVTMPKIQYTNYFQKMISNLITSFPLLSELLEKNNI